MPPSFLWATLGALLLAACSDDDATAVDGAPGEDIDAAVEARDVAVVTTVFRDDDVVLVVMTLEADGTLVDHDIRLPFGYGANAIAIHPDGTEALAVRAGGPDEPSMLHAIMLTPDGSNAEMGQELSLPEPNSPTDVLYTGLNEAIVLMRGPDPDYIATLEKVGDEWQVGPTELCGEGPLRLYDIGEPGHALLLRMDFLEDGGNHALPIGRQEDGSWAIEADGVDLDGNVVIRLGVAPSGDFAYAPVPDPENEDTVNPSGLILSLGVDDESRAWTTVGDLAPLDRGASTIEVSPDGTLMVIADPVVGIDPGTGMQTLDHYEFINIAIASDGSPAQIDGPRASVNATFLEDLQFGPEGHMVVTVDNAGSSFVRVFEQASPGDSQWQEVSFVELEGSSSTLAIALPGGN